MEFREIFRFELVYQARRVRTWIYFAVLFVVAYLLMSGSIEAARGGGPLANAPYRIAAATVISGLLWVLIAPAVAGSAAARDVRTRMDPLVYTTPISKADYLGGRFLAAFVLNGLILLAVPAGILLALLVPGVEPEILGPFRLAAHLSAYVVLALPSAFAVTAVQFSVAALNRRAVVSYVGSVLFVVPLSIGAAVVTDVLHMPTLGTLLDPIGYMTVLGFLSKTWTPAEKNTILVALESSMLANRLLWVGIALGILAVTHIRFRFSHHALSTRSRRALHDDVVDRSAQFAIPDVLRAFGFTTHARQAWAIASTSFWTIAKSASGLLLLAAIAMLVVLIGPIPLHRIGVPQLPTTARVLSLLTAPIAHGPETPWGLIPLLIVFYASELVWRERDAGLSEIADAAPVPEWALILGKFLGLTFVLVVWMALLTIAGVLVQVEMGYSDFEIGLFLKVLFGLQLVDYLLFALLVFVVHAVVNQKHLGYLVALLAYAFIAFASKLGIEHELFVYGSDPGWSYTDMRGFGATLTPWLWFKSYWVAWALLFAVIARLIWVRGREPGLNARAELARQRFTRPTAATAAAAVALILTSGGFIFYNTNGLNAYETASARTERSVEYERRYGQYRSIPQPSLTGTSLRVEIYPGRRTVEIRGTYTLANRGSVAIDKVHLGTSSNVETGAVTFDPPAALVVSDEALGHRIYALEKPLQPGDSLRLGFDVRHEPRGFRTSGGDAFVVANGSYFTNRDWLPAIGYQRDRELRDAGARKKYGLAPRAALPPLDDAEARGRRMDRLAFEAIVGTDEGQTAVAPGALRRTWTELPSALRQAQGGAGSAQGGRRYFHYATDGAILNEYSFFSANYAVHEARWNDVTIKIFQHPDHAANLERMLRGIRASLDYYSEQFGPYPYNHLTVVERGSHGDALNTEASLIDYGEGFSLFRPIDGPRGLDLVFFAMAHEVAHQWWGWQVRPASVQGEVLMAEGLANYLGMQMLEKTYGHEHLRRYLSEVLWASYEAPRTRAAVPLLRADSAFLGYRKGAHALYTTSRYIGEERMNAALRRLVEKHGSGTAPFDSLSRELAQGRPLPTTLDLYRELQAVTPDSLHSLLHDLFEANTFWELETERVTAAQTVAGTWQVALDVRARKVVVDEAGVETEMPMDDWVEIGVFDGNGSDEPLYLQKHRIRSGKQTITVAVSPALREGGQPARAGIDPNNLLIDWQMDDNVRPVRVQQ